MDARRRAIVTALAVGALAKRAHAQNLVTRAIAATGEQLPVIGLGTWQAFDAGDDKAARAPLREVLKVFSQAGARLIDSSPMYGTAEAVAGDLIAEQGARERLFIATKVWASGRAEGQRQMQNSYKRLRVERLDLLQVHNLVDVDTHAKTLAELKHKGRLRYMGITHYTASAYRELEAQLRKGAWDFVQLNYSLAERDAEARLLPLAQERKAAVIINRPFAEGALFRRVKGKELPPWAAELGIESWAQYFLKWIVSHPAVTSAIPGTARPDHMRDNLSAGRGPMPDAAARRRMVEYFDGL